MCRRAYLDQQTGIGESRFLAVLAHGGGDLGILAEAETAADIVHVRRVLVDGVVCDLCVVLRCVAMRCVWFRVVVLTTSFFFSRRRCPGLRLG